jgi:thiamine biosynthesis lipoprotein
VTVPRGVGFDPGGIGKGLAADLVVDELVAEGASGACVNVGGDLRAEGAGPAGGGWVVTVEEPRSSATMASVALTSGAVATSTRTRRTFGRPQEGRHHLIDPATGRPARSGLVAATIVAGRAWQAEVLAKAAFVAGARDGLRLATRFDAEALLVDDDGRTHVTPGFERFAADPPAPRMEARVG